MQINLLLSSFGIAGVSGEAFRDEILKEVEPPERVVLASRDFQTVPGEGYLVADNDFQFAASWLDEADYHRLFLLDGEQDPVILEKLEQYGMPGAISVVTWSRVGTLADPYYPFLRNEVAERLGFERMGGFASPNYARYDTKIPLPAFLVRYLSAFDAWKDERAE